MSFVVWGGVGKSIQTVEFYQFGRGFWVLLESCRVEYVSGGEYGVSVDFEDYQCYFLFFVPVDFYRWTELVLDVDKKKRYHIPSGSFIERLPFQEYQSIMHTPSHSCIVPSSPIIVLLLPTPIETHHNPSKIIASPCF